LAACAEFAGDVDAGFVGEGHAGFEYGLAAVDEIGMLVDVQADTVAEAVSEEFVAGTVPCGGDDSAGGIVYGTGKFSGGWTCCLSRRFHFDGGGGFSKFTGDVSLNYCVVSGNKAVMAGGGFDNGTSDKLVITGSLIELNSAADGGAFESGSGIWI